MFNTTIVVGIAGLISPTALEPDLLTRDIPVMILLTAALFVMGYSFKTKGAGVINRFEGSMLLLAYVAYNMGLVYFVIN